MSARTPGPWHTGIPTQRGHVGLYGDHGQPIGDIDGDRWLADAAFIVRACNAHDALVEALRILIREHDNGRTPIAIDWTQARAALAAVGGGE